MKTLSEVINDLRAKGYETDFNLKENGLECKKSGSFMACHEFKVDRTYRFDVMDDPGEQSVLYAISSESGGPKGILVNGVGIYSDTLTDEMIAKLA